MLYCNYQHLGLVDSTYSIGSRVLKVVVRRGGKSKGLYIGETGGLVFYKRRKKRRRRSLIGYWKAKLWLLLMRRVKAGAICARKVLSFHW